MRKDPRVAVPERRTREQFDLLQQVRDRLSEVHKAVNELRGDSPTGRGLGAPGRTGKPELEAVRAAAARSIDGSSRSRPS